MNLAHRSIQSAGYNVASRGVQAIAQFIGSVILARLLLPEVFGVYVYIVSIVFLTASLPNFGMGAALVHRATQSEGEKARRVHFTLTTIFNLLWALLLMALGPLGVAPANRYFYWAIIIVAVCRNLTWTARATLIRRVAFKRSALLASVGSLAGNGVAIYLAYHDVGVWSLIARDAVGVLIDILGLYVIFPIWKPHFGWDREVGVYLLGLGRRNLLAVILLQALDKVDDIWTGAFLGKQALGYYSRAYTFATYPRQLLASPINQVATGTYAALKEKPEHLSQAFFQINALLIRSGFFMGGLLFLTTPEFVYLVLGTTWLPMITPFRLMLVYTLLDPVKVTIGNVFIAVGEPEKVVRARVWQLFILVLGVFVLGSWLGINGVALAVDIMLVFGIVVLLKDVRAHVQCSFKSLFGVPILAMGFGIGVSYIVVNTFPYKDIPILSAIVKALAFSFPYFVSLFVFERSIWQKIVSIIARFKENSN